MLNPPTVYPPASRYSHGVLTGGPGRRLLISGQVGVRQDGTLAEGLDARLEASFANVLAIVEAAGMRPEHITKLTIFVTVQGAVSAPMRRPRPIWKLPASPAPTGSAKWKARRSPRRDLRRTPPPA